MVVDPLILEGAQGGGDAGFAVSAALVAAGLIAALALLRADGRGERVNLIELQAGQ